MEYVELKTAFHWNCEACGADNFALPQKAELTDEEREEAYREFHSLDDYCELPENWVNFEMVEVPDSVTCSSCGEEYGAIDETDA